MTAAGAVIVCLGITALVTVLAGWITYDAERRLEDVEAQNRRQHDMLQQQAELIDDMNRHIADVSEGWVTYQRSHKYKAIAPIQVIELWGN